MRSIGLSNSQVQEIKSFFPDDFNVILFGSRIKGGWREYSDLDVCIKNSNKSDVSKISIIREKFENSNLAFTVDIVDYHSCDEKFRTIIDQTGINLADL